MNRRPFATLTVLTLVLGACGGGAGDDVSSAQEAETAIQAEGSSAPEDDSGQGGSDTSLATEIEQPPSSDINTAKLTFNGETVQFRTIENGQCFSDFFGNFSVGADLVDASGEFVVPEDVNGLPGVSHNISINVPTNGDVSEGSVIVRLDKIWYADPDVVSGPNNDLYGSVDSFTIEEFHVEGSATFYAPDGEGPISGAFEATCQE